MAQTPQVPYTVVVGLGKTGMSCLAFGVQHNLSIVMMDTRQQPPGLGLMQQQYPDIPLFLGELNSELLLAAETIVLSPGVPLSHPQIAQAQQHGCRIISDIDWFVAHVKAPIIGITGSNGKTTVTTLLGVTLRAAGYKVELCGNIGEPVLAVLEKPVPDYYIMELSSFQLELVESLPLHVAVILNVTEDHLDRYDSFSSYLKAKQRIYLQAQRVVLNMEQPDIHYGVELPEMVKHVALDVMLVAGDFGVMQQEGQSYITRGSDALFNVSTLCLQGKHHQLNVLTVLAICDFLGCPLDDVIASVQQFSGLAHRCQLIKHSNGVKWFNDSKATNVGATIAAVQSIVPELSGRLILIVGGQGKGADFSLLQPVVQQYVDKVMIYGEDACLLQQALHDDLTDLTTFAELSEVVANIETIVKSGDVVLLSPACASFDQFSGFEHRGECFSSWVNKV